MQRQAPLGGHVSTSALLRHAASLTRMCVPPSRAVPCARTPACTHATACAHVRARTPHATAAPKHAAATQAAAPPLAPPARGQSNPLRVCARLGAYLSSHIWPSLLFSRLHRRFALMPRVRLLLMSRFTPPDVPCVACANVFRQQRTRRAMRADAARKQQEAGKRVARTDSASPTPM